MQLHDRARPRRYSNAIRKRDGLERTFAEDIPRCGRRRPRIAALNDPLVTRRILREIGARSELVPHHTGTVIRSCYRSTRSRRTASRRTGAGISSCLIRMRSKW